MKKELYFHFLVSDCLESPSVLTSTLVGGLSSSHRFTLFGFHPPGYSTVYFVSLDSSFWKKKGWLLQAPADPVGRTKQWQASLAGWGRVQGIVHGTVFMTSTSSFWIALPYKSFRQDCSKWVSPGYLGLHILDQPHPVLFVFFFPLLYLLYSFVKPTNWEFDPMRIYVIDISCSLAKAFIIDESPSHSLAPPHS